MTTDTNNRVDAYTLAESAGSCPAPRSRRRVPRRGIAMMLVLGVLAAVTVMTAAALTSQQNAPNTGLNAVADAQARWSAESAASIAAAVLETNFNYTGANAEMMAQQAVACGLVDVCVTTLDGRTPTAEDLELLLTAKSTVNGVTREVQKRISLTPALPIDQAADPHLGEFGIVTTSGLHMDDDVKVTKWGLSPAAASTKPVAVGVFATSGTNLVMGTSPSLANIAVYAGADADAGLASKIISDSYARGGRQLPYKVPVVCEIIPAAFSSLPVATTSDLEVTGPSQDVTLPTGGKYETLEISNGATCRMKQSSGTHYSINDLKMQDSGVLLIEGKVLLEVRSSLSMSNLCAITLADASSGLVIYTKGDAQIDDSGVGVSPAVARDTTRRPASLTAYSSPARLRIYPQPTSAGGNANPQITISSRSIVVGCIHAPTGKVDADQNSVLLGRLTAEKVHFKRGSMLLYDPALDNNSGFTNTKGVLFESGGTAVSAVATTLSTFNPLLGAAALKSTLSGLNAVPVEDEMGGPITLAGAVTARATRIATALPVEPDDDRDNDLVPDDDEDAIDD